MHLVIGWVYIVARCLLSVAAMLITVMASVHVIRSGEFETRQGLVIRRSERPGRFWFYVLGALIGSILVGGAAALILWSLW